MGIKSTSHGPEWKEAAINSMPSSSFVSTSYALQTSNEICSNHSSLQGIVTLSPFTTRLTQE
eukprot:scaffold11959_cov88-Skeletonema_marinoi.AAC.2